MRKIGLIAVVALAAFALPAQAELQNVTIDGEIQIRGNWYDNTAVSPGGTGVVAGVGGAPLQGVGLRYPGQFLPGRPIGSLASGGFGLNSIVSRISGDDDGVNSSFVEQRTRLGVTADFTNDVSAYIEFDAYNLFGEGFRSDFITGSDTFSSTNDVQLYQSYIEAREMWGFPLMARIGRQELAFGSQWLVGTNDTNSFFTGVSFDGIRLQYATDQFSVDAFWTKLAENSDIEEDGDVDFYGVYASYLGLEDITFDAYWLWLRDAREFNDTNLIAPFEAIEDAFGRDDFDTTSIHTFGLRGAGTYGNFDFEAEGAYQTGDAGGAIGSTFRPFGVFGDDDLDLDEWGVNVEVGYTFDMQWTPRVYAGFAYFSSDDERDISFTEWLNPFDEPEGSTAFNRLFSNWEYSEFLDLNGNMSNFWVARGGVSASPTETVDVLLSVSYFSAVDEFDRPISVSLGGFDVPVAPALSFLTEESDDELGWEVGLYLTYAYSEDLEFEVGYARFFNGDGLEDGNFTGGNGLFFQGTTDDDDLNYAYFQTKISF